MNKLKGITSGTYLTKRIKNPEHKNLTKIDICNKCKNNNICKYRNITKFTNGQIYENNVSCDEFYFTISPKAILTLGVDRTTGETIRQSFSGKNEEDAISKALAEKLRIEQNGSFKPITKSEKSIIDIDRNIITEDFKLGKIKGTTYKRKMDTLKQLEKQKFATKPIAKVTREDIINFLEQIKHYSKSTIKQYYELLCMAFGQASYEHIITDNFLTGWKKIRKPKSEYVSHHQISLTLEEQKILVNYLEKVDYEDCQFKYLFLLLLSTGMRIGECLVLDYTKDIDLEKGQIYINKTQTKDDKGKIIIGDTTKTYAGTRILNLNIISKKILQQAYNHKVPNKNNLLFCNKNGTMYTENAVNSSLKRIALKLNIGTYEDYNDKGKLIIKTCLHTHMLRGTFATRCAEAKVNKSVLKKILGHAANGVTDKYYIDVDTEFEKKENTSLEKYLKNNDIFGNTLPLKELETV